MIRYKDFEIDVCITGYGYSCTHIKWDDPESDFPCFWARNIEEAREEIDEQEED